MYNLYKTVFFTVFMAFSQISFGQYAPKTYDEANTIEAALRFNPKVINESGDFSANLRTLSEFFKGAYTNTQTASRDSSAGVKTSLMICQPIWTKKSGKNTLWLYFSRSFIGAENRAFMQYVFKFEQRNRGEIVGRMYGIKPAAAQDNFFAWLETQPFERLSEADLLDEVECDLMVTKFNKGFIIRPKQADCNLINSKSAATSLYTEMVISQQNIESTTSLFDEEGNVIFHNKGQLYNRQTEDNLHQIVEKQLMLAKSTRN